MSIPQLPAMNISHSGPNKTTLLPLKQRIMVASITFRLLWLRAAIFFSQGAAVHCFEGYLSVSWEELFDVQWRVIVKSWMSIMGTQAPSFARSRLPSLLWLRFLYCRRTPPGSMRLYSSEIMCTADPITMDSSQQWSALGPGFSCLAGELFKTGHAHRCDYISWEMHCECIVPYWEASDCREHWCKAFIR